jgi:two-component system, OmpR family, phosphate regulon response regulator OmpR
MNPGRAYNALNMQTLTLPASQAANILVVDDDQRLRDLLDRYLGEQGFGVRSVANADAMDDAMSTESIDMIILDLMLPGEDGLSICRRLRAAGRRLPIIMLTAKGDEADRITGLEIGADDYLPKPFNPRELVARINAVLRRQSPAAAVPGAPDESKHPARFGPFELNIANRTLERNGVLVSLTTGEFAMLKALVTHPRVPLSRDRLMELARGREYGMYDRSIDVQVSRLRKLIEDDPAKPRYLQTVWGVGYVFVPDEK